MKNPSKEIARGKKRKLTHDPVAPQQVRTVSQSLSDQGRKLQRYQADFYIQFHDAGGVRTPLCLRRVCSGACGCLRIHCTTNIL